MRHLLLTACLALGTMLTANSPAHACINDGDTYRIEREFRKNYEFKSGGWNDAVQESPAESESREPLVLTLGRYGLSGLGVVFLLATAGIVSYNFHKIGSA